MKKTLFTALFFCLLNTVSAQQQADTKRLIKNFVVSIIARVETPRQIMEKYMYFEPSGKLTMEARATMLDAHLHKIRNGELSGHNTERQSVVPYDSFGGEKVRFSAETEHMWILLNNAKPLMYFYIKKGKIYSFDYMLKGREGYFLTY